MISFDPYEFERPPIVLTEADRARLAPLADAAVQDNPNVARFLHEELARADIVPEGAAGSVIMGSDVKFIDHRSAKIRRCKLAYPDEANDNHSISVLTPIGSALLGLGPGQSINWTDAGIEKRLTVLEVSSGLPKQLADSSAIATRPFAADAFRSDILTRKRAYHIDYLANHPRRESNFLELQVASFT